MDTINISIPADWLPEQRPSPAELREALRLGLKQLRRQQSDLQQHRERVGMILAEAGLAQPQLDRTAAPPLSPEQRRKLAQRAAAAGPLSEVIIADRAGDRL